MAAPAISTHCTATTTTAAATTTASAFGAIKDAALEHASAVLSARVAPKRAGGTRGKSTHGY